MLTTKKDIRPSSKVGVKLDKLPERTMFGKTVPPDLTDDLPQLKTVKLTKSEQQFIKEYRRLEDLEREKGIKFF